MSETVKKYVVIDYATGEELVSYDNQAPATTMAKRYSKPRWHRDTETRIEVEERTYSLVSKKVVRVADNGKLV